MEISRTRFVVMGAPTMLDLLNSMNQLAHPLSRCIYYGKNEGDYSQHPEHDKIETAKFIAVFDYAPVQAYLIDNLQIFVSNDESDSSSEELDNNDIAMSA